MFLKVPAAIINYGSFSLLFYDVMVTTEYLRESSPIGIQHKKTVRVLLMNKNK